MKNIALSIDVKSIIVDVSQEILEKNILDFTYSSLELNNITYKSTDKIYCNFLKYSNQYQIFVFNNNFEYMIFELLSNTENLDFTLYITKDFFVVFEKNKFYTYQKTNQEYLEDELLEYINKNFNISITTIIKLDENEVNKIIENKDFNLYKSNLKNINIKSNKTFLLYLSYLLICVLGTFFYQEFEEKSLHKDRAIKQNLAKKEYSKTIKKLKFTPYEKEYEKLIKRINKLDLKLVSLTYSNSRMKIKVHSKKKNNIYVFLAAYQKRLQSNNIRKLTSKNIFESILNVKIN
ncbi:MAG: hypothetical protein ACPG9K_01630 [Poseidonibacter sp.]